MKYEFFKAEPCNSGVLWKGVEKIYRKLQNTNRVMWSVIIHDIISYYELLFSLKLRK